MRDPDEADDCLRLLSGRAHRVYTGADADHAERGASASAWSRRACASSACRATRSTPISASGEWRGKAGGYAIQGLAGAFVVRLIGSYSERRRPAARRDGGAARRRRLSRPPQLDAGRLKRWRRRETSARKRKRRPQRAQDLRDLRQAARSALRSVLLEALRRRRPPPLAERRLCRPRRPDRARRAGRRSGLSRSYSAARRLLWAVSARRLALEKLSAAVM